MVTRMKIPDPSQRTPDSLYPQAAARSREGGFGRGQGAVLAGAGGDPETHLRPPRRYTGRIFQGARASRSERSWGSAAKAEWRSWHPMKRTTSATESNSRKKSSR